MVIVVTDSVKREFHWRPMEFSKIYLVRLIQKARLIMPNWRKGRNTWTKDENLMWSKFSPWAFDRWSSRPGCRRRGGSCWGELGGRRSSRWRSRTRTRSDPREKTTWKRQIQSLLWDRCLSCDVLTGKLDIYCRYVPGFMKLALGGLPI